MEQHLTLIAIDGVRVSSVDKWVLMNCVSCYRCHYHIFSDVTRFLALALFAEVAWNHHPYPVDTVGVYNNWLIVVLASAYYYGR